MFEYIKRPMEIENKSFQIIEEELGDKVLEFTPQELAVVKRVIHTTGDFDYANLIEFTPNAIEKAQIALKKEPKIYCDTNMIVSGLNKKTLKALNITPYTLVDNEEVTKIATERKVTRSIAGIEQATKDSRTKIFLIGNAPTALFKLRELVQSGEIEKPDLIVGVPVGFVGAEESKKIFQDTDIPYITVHGRKGGSPVAVAILHGILYGVSRV